jgi:NAD(P)-dependent dehydrogenase (short-subunit alcohol dehydrogenase family)
MEQRPVVLVTGASRPTGLGAEVARQLVARGSVVVLTARDPAAAAARAAEIGEGVVPLALDVTDRRSIDAALAEIERRVGRLDAVVSNANAVFDFAAPVLEPDPEAALRTFDTDVLGAWRLVTAALPLLRRSPHPRVVMVSSEAASFGSPGGMAARPATLGAYTLAKAALNALTVKLATALADTPVLVNAVCPGWVATYPGTAEMGARPVPEGAAAIVWAATLPDDGPRGGWFRDGAPLPW